MTRDNLKENEAGALALADALTVAGDAAKAIGKTDLARRFYSANAKARAFAAELHALAVYKENDDG